VLSRSSFCALFPTTLPLVPNRMTFTTLLGHFSNFIAPALWMAAAAVLFGGFVASTPGPRWPKRLACDFVVGLVVMSVGWMVLGSDGKMATWAGLVLAVAVSECLLRQAWRK
jgi:hypothetical protein